MSIPICNKPDCRKWIPLGFIVVTKDWAFSPLREVFRRFKDGLEIDKDFTYTYIAEHNEWETGLEKTLNKLANLGGYVSP